MSDARQAAGPRTMTMAALLRLAGDPDISRRRGGGGTFQAVALGENGESQ